MSALHRPPLLARGDRVAIVAPSGPVDPARFFAGIECLRDWGLEPVFDASENGVLARKGFLAGNDQRRLAELQAALDDRDNKAIWLARGGYGAARLLDALSCDAIDRAGRWLIGFSDASALHALWARAGWQSMHAAVVSNVADWSPPARAALAGWLFEGVGAVLHAKAVAGAERAVTGRLAGGNITVLASLCGTAMLPDWREAIVFLEDIGEAPYRLNRSLWQLRQSGAFDGVVGFAIGQLSHCHDPRDYGCSALDAVLEVLEHFDVPVLCGLDVGHDRSSWSLPFGALAHLDPRSKSLRYD